MSNCNVTSRGRKPLLWSAVLATLCFATAGTASAAFLGFRDTYGTISIGVGGFEGAFSYGGLVFSGTMTLAGPAKIDFDGTWIDHGLTQPVSRLVYFVMPGTEQIVDTLQYTASSHIGTYGVITGTFYSDNTGGLGILPPGVSKSDVFQADGREWLDFGQPYLLASAMASVPEPTCLALIGVTAGLLTARRRRSI